MVKFEIKVHPKQRLAYIPKEIVDALGTRLEAVPNLQGLFLYPKGLTPEQTLNSMKAIYQHFQQEVELEEHVKVSALAKYRKQIKRDKCSCGFEGLKDLPIEHYPHSGGWTVEGFQEKQWLFVSCPNCKQQWALWKLGVPREKEDPQGERY